MKGDFSRIRFNPRRLYTAVLKQQGRVDLDSDAIEQCAIDVTLRQTTNADIIGPYGGPFEGAGFEINVDGDDIWISPGRYYVEGILVEIWNRVHYDRQPYLIDPTHSAQDLLNSLSQAGKGSCLQFELEVWQRMATALDDPCLLEPALNSADTTTRLQTIWRVVGTLQPASPVPAADHSGQMGAATSGDGSGCGCTPIPAAGYQGMENQLYRVEIHQSGDLTSATFKWSRENGSVVTAVTDVNAATVTVTGLGPDANLGYQVGQWVELSDDTNQFGPSPNQAGSLYQIFSINHAALQVTMTAPVTGLHKYRNARMRRWDQSGPSATASGIPVSSTPVPLENGIVVDFSKGEFQSGDYWTIPARSANGSIDWPPCGGDGRHFQPSNNMPLYQAPLACVFLATVKGDNTGKFAVSDERSFFTPMSVGAIHVEDISWNNADLMTLDQLLSNGLNVTLNAAPTSRLDAGVFRVSLEIAGYGYFRQFANTEAANRLASLKKAGAATSGAQESQAPPQSRIRIGPALRTEYVLDGLVRLEDVNLKGWVVRWVFPAETDQGELIYALNNLLLDSYQSSSLTKQGAAAVPGARVRVRLFGHMIFAEASSSCGPGNTIYLDGQCFGKTAQLSDGSKGIALSEPSGSGAAASDFESWFYLAPAPEVESLEFNPDVMTLNAGAIGAATGATSATSQGTVSLAMPASAAVTIGLTASPQTGLTVSFSATSLVIAAGQSSQTFTITVQASDTAPNGQVTLTVTAAPQLETDDLSQIFSAQGELYITVNNPLAVTTTSLPYGIEDKSYSTTLAAAGGTPPYTWSFASGTLPGLSVSAAGVISGTAGKAGEFNVVVKAADSASPSATATKPLTLDVYNPLEITTTSPIQWPSGSDFKTQLAAQGGKSPYKWRLAAGSAALPSGLSLSTEGVISGTTFVSGEPVVNFEVADSLAPAQTATKKIAFFIPENPK